MPAAATWDRGAVSTPPGPVRHGRVDTSSRLLHVLPLALLLALFLVVARSAFATVTNADTFFHLRFGHEFLTGGWSLRHPGSVTSLGTNAWTPTQWLPQVVMARFDGWFGLGGVAWLTCAQILALAVALFAACRRLAAPAAAVSATLLALAAAGGGLSGRPQVLSYLLVVVTTDAWLRTRADARVRWWLVPLTWVWAMVHGMWPVGVLIGAVAVLGGALDGRGDRPAALRSAGREALVPALSLLVAGLTPVGPAAYGAVVAVGDRARYIPEWGAPDFTSLDPLVLLAMFALLLAVRVRTGGMDWTRTLFLLVAGGWAVYATRTVPLAAVMLAPLLAESLQQLLPERSPVPRWERRTVVGGALGTLVLVGLLLPRVDVSPPDGGAVSVALDALPASTTVLNEWSRGGYLMWRHPGLDFGMNGYVDLYTEPEIANLTTLLASGPGWEDRLRDSGATRALLRPSSPLLDGLEQQLGWTVVAQSPTEVLVRAPAGTG